jgi:hypothetical protein
LTTNQKLYLKWGFAPNPTLPGAARRKAGLQGTAALCLHPCESIFYLCSDQEK